MARARAAVAVVEILLPGPEAKVVMVVFMVLVVPRVEMLVQEAHQAMVAVVPLVFWFFHIRLRQPNLSSFRAFNHSST